MIGIREYVEKKIRQYDHGLVRRSLIFAEECLAGKKRKDGLPYIEHPVEVAYHLYIAGEKDQITLGIGLNHDDIEEVKDNEGRIMSQAEIAERTSPEIALGTAKLTRLKRYMSYDELVLYYQDFEDEVPLVKVKHADRVSNMRRSMFGVYEQFSMKRYVFEGYHFILPQSERLIDKGISEKDERILRVLRSQIKGLLRAAESYVKYMEMEEHLNKIIIPKSELLFEELGIREEEI